MKNLLWLLLVALLASFTLSGHVERERYYRMGTAGEKFCPEWPVDYIPEAPGQQVKRRQ